MVNIKENILLKAEQIKVKKIDLAKTENAVSTLMQTQLKKTDAVSEKISLVNEKLDQLKKVIDEPNHLFCYGNIFDGMTTKLVRTKAILNVYTNDGEIKSREIVTINKNGLNKKTEYTSENYYNTKSYDLYFRDFISVLFTPSLEKNVINSLGKANRERLKVSFDAFKDCITKNPLISVCDENGLSIDKFQDVRKVFDVKEYSIPLDIKDFKIIEMEYVEDSNGRNEVLSPTIATVNLKRVYLDLDCSNILRLEVKTKLDNNTNGLRDLTLDKDERIITLEPFRADIIKMLDKMVDSLDKWIEKIEPLNAELKEKLAPYTLAGEL